MSGESFNEQVERLEMMCDPKQWTWDLSGNDQAAIRAVLSKLSEAQQEVDRLRVNHGHAIEAHK
jgi:hypothetical protein